MLSPDIWTDEGFIECSPLARLLFIGLISHADDHGRGYAGALALRSKIFPADTFKNGELERALAETASKLRVRFYSVDERQYYQLDRWLQHQYVQKKQDSLIAPPPGGDDEQTAVSYQYDSGTIAVSPNRIEKKRIEKKEEKRPFAQFVTMTEEEHAKLIETYGSEATRKAIERLDNYKGSSGKRYKSDYRALLAWVVEALGLQPLAAKTTATWKCPQCGVMHTSSYKACECGYGR